MNRPELHQTDQQGRTGALARLRQDFDLAIMVSFGSVAVVVVTGFAAFRFLTGNLMGGLVNTAITTVIVALLVYAWWSGNSRRAGHLFVLITALACVASALVFGRTGLFWTYLVLSINFVLTRRPWALSVNLALTLTLGAQDHFFDSGTERVAFAVTALLITVYGWIYSKRFDEQRLRLESMASLDPLTGAGNRRLLQRDLDAAVHAKHRYDTPAVLAVLDLDHFKRVNDTQGHEAGDRALMELAAVARARLRRTDGLYRFGGEEFVVLLPHTDMTKAHAMLAELHRLLDAGLAACGTPVTVSIGAAELAPDENWSTWLGRADAALYRAKQEGRDRLVLA